MAMKRFRTGLVGAAGTDGGGHCGPARAAAAHHGRCAHRSQQRLHRSYGAQGPTLASAIGWNEADRGGALVRRWIDQNNVGVIADMPTMAIRPRRAVELITTGAA
ncbi:hypothetical protein [Xanthobacter autotrophicus]|uniref:hypothetical protein n=1 Tax=Xanthobacter autotrophicus TaxID=280 RepID=UPI00372BC493